ISTARARCVEKKEIWDAYWNCYDLGESGEPFSPIAYQDGLRRLWLDHVITRPLRYLEYRTAVYSNFFFSSSLEYWPWEWNGSARDVGIEIGSERADYIFRPYVEDFALATFPMLFKPWFWSLLAAALIVLVRRWPRRGAALVSVTALPTTGATLTSSLRTSASSLRPEITMLAVSALSYTIGYFPIVPTNHFRYTYWPALAVTIGLALTVGMWSARRRRAGGVQRARKLAS
uniref:hypothetical protein n=1 Tax=Brevibacterium casei TaxID=33889 RepID=UPI001C92CE71